MPAWRASAAVSSEDDALDPHLDGLAIGLGLDVEQDGAARLEQSSREAASISEKTTASNWPVGSEKATKA